jgi:hypothetical protein
MKSPTIALFSSVLAVENNTSTATTRSLKKQPANSGVDMQDRLALTTRKATRSQLCGIKDTGRRLQDDLPTRVQYITEKDAPTVVSLTLLTI